MDWIIDFLAGYVNDLRGASPLTQIVNLMALPSIILTFSLWLNRKARLALSQLDQLRAEIDTAGKERKRLEARTAALDARIDALTAATPEAFVAKHARQMRDGNVELAMGDAEKFIDGQRDALLLAFRTRMDEAIRQSVEDGAAGFENALGWARAALILDPGDNALHSLAAELVEAAAVAASGARVRLKDDKARAERIARNERLPTDLATLADAFFTARDRGHYGLMLFLADHGLMLTRRGPGGQGSDAHLLFRRHRSEALMCTGRPREALAEGLSLIADFSSAFGARRQETLYLRYLIANCRRDIGDAATALDELEGLLPLEIEVLGERSISTLTCRGLIATCRQDIGDTTTALDELRDLLPLMTEVLGERAIDVLIVRYAVATCRQDIGDTATALDELRDLLPLMTEVLGEQHSHVLGTRQVIAACRRDIGDAATALDELRELLPLQTEILGEHHSRVLESRRLMADCLLDLGDRAGARAATDGLREGYEAVGLKPEHRYLQQLAKLEARLRND